MNYPNLSDPVFIDRLRKGEESAFYELVEGMKDRVYNTVLGLVQHVEDAEDITQEVFITAWKSMGKFRAEASVTTWLYKIAVNQSLDALRKRKRKKRFGWILPLNGENSDEDIHPGDFCHPGVQMEKKQEAQVLLKAIRKLPEQQQVAYSLQKMEGLALKEIAQIMESTDGAVEALLNRAKINLKKTLITYYEHHKHE